MASGLDPVELDEIPLPPIPGPLPATFFTDIPLGSAAVLSTVLGTRPFQPLPNPVPVHAVRSGSEDDIRKKACSVFKTYHAIAESIVTPPVAWQDLYQYFDAKDLWMEGAGFLFHVLGYIVRVNITKTKYIQNYAREWAFGNEVRLSNMSPHQDMLSSLQTPDDQAWFDYGGMSFRDKEILNSVLKQHCEAFQVKRISQLAVDMSKSVQVAVEAQRIPPAVKSSVPVQIVVEAQRVPYDMSADPYQHFGKLDHKISPRLSNNSPQSMAMHWEPSGNQDQTISNPYYRTRNNTQSYGGSRGSINENQNQAVPRNVPGTTENQFVPIEGYHHFTYDRRQGARGGRPPGSFPRQTPGFKGPVYVLDPQKSLVRFNSEAFGAQGAHHTRTSPVYSSQQPENVSFQGRNAQDRRADMQYVNHTFVMSNDARLHYDGRFNHLDNGARSMQQEHSKHTARKVSWPESNFDGVCSVFVAGFPAEVSAAHHLEKLFSECGEINEVSVFHEKHYAFINFKNPGSALGAINRFDGYSMEGGRSLTVRYSKGKARTNSYGNRDAQQAILGAPLRAWTHDLPSALMRNGGNDSRENRNHTRITPPRNHVHSPSNPSYTLPPNPFEQAGDCTTIAQIAVAPVKAGNLEPRLLDLPAKPQFQPTNSTWDGSPSTTFRPQLDGVQSLLRTPDKAQHVAGLGQMSDTRRKGSVEGSGQSGGRRVYGSENSKLRRKTLQKPKTVHSSSRIQVPGDSVDVPNNNFRKTVSTHAPVRKILATSVGSLTVESRNANLISSATLPVLSTQSAVNGSLSNGRGSTTNDDVLQLQDSSSCGTECSQIDSSTSSSDAKSDSVSSAGPGCSNVLVQASGACAGISYRKSLSSDSGPAAALEIAIVSSADVLDPPTDPRGPEISAEPSQLQKKKTYKNRKRSLNQSYGGRGDVKAENMVPPLLRSSPNNGTRDISKAENRSHIKTNSNTTSSSSTSGRGTSLKAEPTGSAPHRSSKAKGSPRRNASGNFTPPGIPRLQLHQAKRPTKSKSNDGGDIFHDAKVSPVEHTQDGNQLDQGNVDINGSTTPSTGTINSSAKNSRGQNREESPTPTRKPRSRPRNNKSDQKTSTPSRKENKKPSPSPNEILSDPSNWPALGSTKLQLDTTSGSIQKTTSLAKPPSERALPRAPLRRDSMASVVSQPAQTVRRLTIDSPSSPVSGGSPLWPVVKRWDSHGRPPGDTGNPTPSSNGNI